MLYRKVVIYNSCNPLLNSCLMALKQCLSREIFASSSRQKNQNVMEIKVIMLINLLAYSFIVSQSFTYIIALKNVQTSMEPASYIELRKLLDKNFQVKFRIVVYVTLLTCTVLTVLSSMHLTGLLFITSALGLAGLIVEILLAVKGNVPINRVINSWSADNYPANWKDYRAKWLAIFAKRQVVNIIGFLSLLIGAVFAS